MKTPMKSRQRKNLKRDLLSVLEVVGQKEKIKIKTEAMSQK